MKLSIQIKEFDSSTFRASCPSLPGCVVYAQTREEARRRMEEAVRAYLISLHNFVPEDTARALKWDDT